MNRAAGYSCCAVARSEDSERPRECRPHTMGGRNRNDELQMKQTLLTIEGSPPPPDVVGFRAQHATCSPFLRPPMRRSIC
jgi:hypothetical protein